MFNGQNYYEALKLEAKNASTLSPSDICMAYKKLAIPLKDKIDSQREQGVVQSVAQKDTKTSDEYQNTIFDFYILTEITMQLNDHVQKQLYDINPVVIDRSAYSSKFDQKDEKNEKVNALVTTSLANFESLTKHSIDTFSNKYRNSPQERLDVFKAYVDCKGDLNQMIDRIMLSVPEDKARYRQWINEGILLGEVTGLYPLIDQTPNSNALAIDLFADERDGETDNRTEQKLAAEHELKYGLVDLKTKEAKRHKDMIATLTAKYCKPKRKRSEEKEVTSDFNSDVVGLNADEINEEEPSEEDFLKIQAEIDKNYKAAKAKRVRLEAQE